VILGKKKHLMLTVLSQFVILEYFYCIWG